jgi:hypothetical protein
VAYAEYLLIIAIFAYASYWAYNIRHALVVRLYRNQASGAGLVGAVLALTVSIVAADVTGNQTIITPFALITILTTFYFIDSSVLAARRSDPLLRDTLGWTRLRLLLWPTLVVLAVVGGAANITIPNPSFEETVFFSSPYFVALGAGLATLPAAALRSKDITLRGHFRWFGLFALFLLFFVIATIPTSSINFSTSGFTTAVIFDFEAAFVFMFVAGYCLYRSARSLAPMNKLSLIELTSPFNKETSLRPSTSFS